jgi:hypothetical protein
MKKVKGGGEGGNGVAAEEAGKGIHGTGSGLEKLGRPIRGIESGVEFKTKVTERGNTLNNAALIRKRIGGDTFHIERVVETGIS